MERFIGWGEDATVRAGRRCDLRRVEGPSARRHPWGAIPARRLRRWGDPKEASGDPGSRTTGW